MGTKIEMRVALRLIMSKPCKILQELQKLIGINPKILKNTEASKPKRTCKFKEAVVVAKRMPKAALFSEQII